MNGELLLDTTSARVRIGGTTRFTAVRLTANASNVDFAPDYTLADLVSDAAQPVAYAETPVGQVADLIVESGVGRIPIVDPATRRVVGILSRHDLLKARHSHRQTETARASFMAPGASE